MNRPAARVFAAIDSLNRIRFIDDVPAGMACGCFCAACSSALVARKGDINVHHFAHESRQERPECLAGAMNLLRRLATEYLRTQGVPPIPKYQKEVYRTLQSGRAVERIEWDAQPRAIRWLEPTKQDDPVAVLSLDNGIEADLLVVVSEVAPLPRILDSRRGLIAYWSSVPVDSDLRKEIYALQHLRRWGLLTWLYQPDVFGLVAAAQNRLAARAEYEEKLANERVERHRIAFESRPVPPTQPAWPSNMHQSGLAPSVDAPSWTMPKKRNVSFFGYRLADGSVWVYFELAQGGYGLRDLRGIGTWYEKIREGAGTYDASLDLIRCERVPMMGHSAAATQISTNFADILRLLK